MMMFGTSMPVVKRRLSGPLPPAKQFDCYLPVRCESTIDLGDRQHQCYHHKGHGGTHHCPKHVTGERYWIGWNT